MTDEEIDARRNERWEWARAEATRAVLSDPNRTRSSASIRMDTMLINAYAYIIMTGEMPEAPPGVTW